MAFNSLEFLYLLGITFAVYYLLPPQRCRNLFLLGISYFFYMWWRPDYAVLMTFTSLVGYATALGIERCDKSGGGRLNLGRTAFLVASLVINLGILFVFKYYLFTRASLIFLRETFPALPAGLELPYLDVLLPVGISFYTFQTIGYNIDVYWRRLPAEKNFLTFALFVSFFPQLVAGPIERAQRFLPQFHEHHRFEYENIRDGILLVLWGFFKKVVIADRLSVYVNTVYNNPGDMYGLPIWIATVFFAFQIYCDFSGYTDIARGTARMFGFTLTENFKMPYIAGSFHDFWKRWHISLTSWFRDYLYIPLGGNRVSKPRWLTNIMIIFVVSGLWHGANWTYVIWGAIHGTLQLIEILTAPMRNRFYESPVVKRIPVVAVNAFHTVFVFTVVCFAWLFFRANTLTDAATLLQHAVVFPNWNIHVESALSVTQLKLAFLLIVFLYCAELVNLRTPVKNLLQRSPLPIRWGFYIFAVFFVLLFGVYSDIASFIYFQF